MFDDTTLSLPQGSPPTICYILENQRKVFGFKSPLRTTTMSFLTPGRYIEEKSPLRLQLKKLNNFFTDEEYDLLYCLVHKTLQKVEDANKQGITQELKIS